jgi:hypothetical protein
MATVLIDGDPLIPLIEQDERTEVVIDKLGSQVQAEHFAETMVGVVVLTRRSDGWAILKPPIDIVVARNAPGAARGGKYAQARRGITER